MADHHSDGSHAARGVHGPSAKHADEISPAHEHAQPPREATPLHDVMRLQRAVGNRATMRLLDASPPRAGSVAQRKLDGDLTVSGIIEALKKQYDTAGKTINYATLRPFIDDQTKVYSVSDIATALKLKPLDGSEIAPVEKSPQPAIAPEKQIETVIEQVIEQPLVRPARPLPVTLEIATAAPAKVPDADAVPKSGAAASVSAPGAEFSIDGLNTLISELFLAKSAVGGKPPSKDEIMAALVKTYKEKLQVLVETAEFVYAFQDAIRAQQTGPQNRKFLDKTVIEDTGGSQNVGTYKAADISKWTLRHYSDKGDGVTPPPFMTIKSAMSLSAMGIDPTERITEKKTEKKSGHTGDRDWNKYGNTGNTFYLLFIDGVPVQKQKFLDNAKWYAEFPFSQPNLWLSSDWLDEAGIIGPTLRGPGHLVQQSLLKLGGNLPIPMFRKSLEDKFHNLEVKVPGTLNVDAWHKA